MPWPQTDGLEGETGQGGGGGEEDRGGLGGEGEGEYQEEMCSSGSQERYKKMMLFHPPFLGMLLLPFA